MTGEPVALLVVLLIPALMLDVVRVPDGSVDSSAVFASETRVEETVPKLSAALLDSCAASSRLVDDSPWLASEMKVLDASLFGEDMLASRGVRALFGPGCGSRNVDESDV